MFAFRKAIPQALHQKLLGLSPAPVTLAELVNKAREFDRVWRLYSNPAFTGKDVRSSGPRNRALTTETNTATINATTTPPKQQRPALNLGKLSKEEKDRRYREKLCFYCGKPNHISKDCRTKKAGQGRFNSDNPRSDFRTRASTTHDEVYEEPPEDHPAQVAALTFSESSPDF